MSQAGQKLLLDTHTLIWFLEGDQALSGQAKASIEGKGVTNYVSVATLWEIAIKSSLGKLTLKQDFSRLELLVQQNGFYVLPINFEHLKKVKTLSFHHRDPFDRLIIAQSLVERLDIVTKDPAFPAYGVSIIW